MRIKNVIIAFLLISNIFCMILMYKLAYGPINLDTIESNRIFDPIRKHALDKDASQEGKPLFSLYNTSYTNCGAAVSLSERNGFGGAPVLDMACLLAGKREVIWETLQSVKNFLFQQLFSFVLATEEEHIREINGISFRPEGERKALLLAKFILMKDHGNIERNDYLIGILLGYEVDDILFFYKRSFYLDYLYENNKETDIPYSYATFSPELKKQFESFIIHNWINSEEQSKFELDKKNAKEWIEEHKKYSIDQLYKQIEEQKNDIHI